MHRSGSITGVEAFRRIRSNSGLLVATVTIGALLGLVATRFVQSRTPIAAVYRAPHLEHALPVDTNSVFIEACVDSKGRVWNYRVISNRRASRDLSSEMKNVLTFTTFRTATYMGAPVASTAVFSLPEASFENR
jgi:hypothetical protein